MLPYSEQGEQRANAHRFTGPKMTIDVDGVSLDSDQEKTSGKEGLEIHGINPIQHGDGTVNDAESPPVKTG